MRIVMVTYGFPRLSETFLVRKFLALRKMDHDVRVVCHYSEIEDWERFEDMLSRDEIGPSVTVSPVPPPWIAKLPRGIWLVLRSLLVRPISTVRYLGGSVRELGLSAFPMLYLDAPFIGLKPDVIHFEFGSQAVGRMHLGKALDCAVVASFRGHDINFVGLDDPDYYADVWKHADGVHFLSQHLFRAAQERGFEPEGVVALIPPAVEVDSVEPHTERSASETVRLLSVGRMNWTKGHEYLLQAVRLLVDEGHSVNLRIVGGGDYLESVAFTRHQLDLEKHVDLLGHMPPSQVREEMLRADVFVHAAVSEGFCNAVVEAQGSGLPVVTTDAGGLPENVADGVTGIVVARRDPRALATAISSLIRDRALRERMGSAGRRRVAEHFALADQGQAFDRFYSAALERRGTLAG